MAGKGGPRYLMWYDDNPKISLLTKIEEAIHAYTRRFARAPNVVLVNQQDVTEYRDMAILGVAFVQRNNFWVGFDKTLEV